MLPLNPAPGWQQLEGMESGELHAPTLSLLCPGSWHHIQNLDSFFTKISFLCAAWQKGQAGGWVPWAGDLAGDREASSGKAHHASG